MSQITVNNLSELPTAAKEIVQSFHGERVVLLYGEMGAGKTTLIKSLCEAMGVKDSVSSPTFSIINEYHTQHGDKIYHFDFYRIKSAEEAYDLGYEDYFYSGNYCLIEWPEKISELLPLESQKISITVKGDQRVINY